MNITGRSEENLNYKVCSTTDDCGDPGEITCHGGTCFCIESLQKADRYGRCSSKSHKTCTENNDCYEPDTVCQDNDGFHTKVCFCIYTLQPTNEYGECVSADKPPPDKRNDVFPVQPLVGLFGPGDNNTISETKQVRNETEPLYKQSDNMSDQLTAIQIFIPLASALFVLFALFLIVARRIKLCKRKRRKESTVKTTEDEQLLDRMNFVNKNPTYFLSPHDNVKGRKFNIKDIPSEQMKIVDVVGEGAFGQVYKGIYSAEDGSEIGNVAVKVLKDGVSNEVKDDFEREVEIMSAFDHDNILKLLGVVTKGLEGTPYMIFEYMLHGDLAELLRHNDPVMRKHTDDMILQKTDLIDIAIQIANGMAYLTSQHFVHRDLATRNCLVGDGLVVKISDFGMARDVYTCDYYRIGGSRMLPVRWMSPESVKYGRFTTESDIWAFGVVLWEIFSYGRQPYYGHSNEEVVRFLDEGILLQRPEECPSTVYHVMLGCWKSDPRERLVFVKSYNHLVDYSKTIMRSAHMQSVDMDGEGDLITS
ncbi:BDNF/NT-3 growth factors receptor-like isoform X2 [Pecten maximus]|uniref:BDNF/NT-3 growth factors receptor-like isoform X2 n=1 Tax=Pecten maximus TaxID=6579 RepID=UPI0014583974|nr:BDNF/NT-3 growth factors receptor-like isoform X2 [Pecten maximus]